MSDVDLGQARHNMIEQQIRTWDVLDQDILDLIDSVPRDPFVPAEYRNVAYSDMQIPLGRDQVMMHPRVEARMLQALDVQPHEKVLEIGTGSGYVTALLSRLAEQVNSVEYIPEFKLEAAQRLAAHGCDNVQLEVGDAAQGWERHGPYDIIAITGSLPVLPEAFRQQLNIGGRLFAIVGDDPVMEAELITRVGEEDFVSESLFETSLPPLINAAQPERFTF